MAARQVKTDTLPTQARIAVGAARAGQVRRAGPPPTMRMPDKVKETPVASPVEILKTLPSGELQKLLTQVQDELRSRGERVVPDLSQTLAEWKRRNNL